MRCQLVLALVGLVNWLLFCTDTSAEQTAEELLKERNLRKVNQVYVLPEEVDLLKDYRQLETLRKKVSDAQQAVAQAKAKVEQKKKLLLDYAQQRRMLRAQIQNARSVELHNKLVNMSNELVDRSIILEKSDQEEKDYEAARTTASTLAEQYVERLLQFRRQYDTVAEQYVQLAADRDVVEAIKQLSAAGPRPCKLGPAGAFATLDRNLKKLEAKVLVEEIELRRGEGNLWHVQATFNGKHTRQIAIDTGASVIALPHKVAEQAGLKPAADDQTIQVTLADGRMVEAHLVRAATVRVGKFTAENVECAVMPPDFTEATPLLGLSFFNHFNFKIDNARGKLIMTKVEQLDAGPRRRQ